MNALRDYKKDALIKMFSVLLDPPQILQKCAPLFGGLPSYLTSTTLFFFLFPQVVLFFSRFIHLGPKMTSLLYGNLPKSNQPKINVRNLFSVGPETVFILCGNSLQNSGIHPDTLPPDSIIIHYGFQVRNIFCFLIFAGLQYTGKQAEMLGLGLSPKTRFGTRTIDLKYSADLNTGCVRYLNVLKEVHILNGMTSQPFEIQTFGCHLRSLLSPCERSE